MSEEKTVEQIILEYLNTNEVIPDLRDWASQSNLKYNDALVGAIKRIEGEKMVVTELFEKKVIGLSAEAEEIIKLGSAEVRTFNAIPEQGIPKGELESKLGDVAKIGFAQAMKSKWIAFDKATNTVTRTVASVTDTTRDQLEAIKNSPQTADAQIVAALKKRKLVEPATLKTFKVTKGNNFALEVKKLPADITAEMIASGSWKDTVFKEYNLNALGTATSGGHLHPLLKVREQFRKIFLEMGFEEMPTNNFVESSFWNFDTLFQPQQHPARDAHDTFFLSDPAEAKYFPEDYLQRVKDMHEKGGNGSIGWRYDWKREETQKNILRTHTTSVSSRMLYKLAQEGFKPKKYFSIDRVFRNEALDATHLAEFHQIEGVIADYNLTLGDLIGVFSKFYERLGIKKLRFKPAFNPYTEPSMEIFSYHEGLKRWVEVGNSGIFRPEMLEPMGLPAGVRVLAWGLSLERPTMIKYGISNIRELIGHKIDVDFVKNNPICRLDK